MRSRYRKIVSLGGLAFLCLAPDAWSQTVSMELIAPPDGPSMAGVYTSPYTALIGPAGQTIATITGTPTAVICDDFSTDVSIATPPWQATVTNMSALQGESTTSKVVKFDHGATVAQQIQDYMTVAYLAEELMGIDQSKPAGQTLAGELSFAIWAVFDPTAMASLTLSQGILASVYLAAAQVAVLGRSPNSFSDVTIYTASPQGASQEYLTVTAPEAPALALLACDLSLLGGLLFLFRRRILRTAVSS